MIEDIISLANKEVGVKASNDYTCKYTAEYGYKGAWCVMFIWWLFKHTNISKLFYDGNKTASCTILYKWALAKGQVVSVPKRGDIIIFKFSTKKGYELHMGICEDFDGKYIYTIDGNTCATGAEYNGGEVMKKKRNKSYIQYVIRPLYEENNDENNDEIYVVKKGDSLWKIAVLYYGKGSLWTKIYEYNDLDSTNIKVGQKLKIPKGV